MVKAQKNVQSNFIVSENLQLDRLCAMQCTSHEFFFSSKRRSSRSGVLNHVTVCRLDSIQGFNFGFTIGPIKVNLEFSLAISGLLNFVRPEAPKQRATTAPFCQSKRHLKVFFINEIVPGYVVYLVKISISGPLSNC